MSLLKVAARSAVPGARSAPLRLLASACANHVLATGAPAKSRCTVLGPAKPSSAPPPPHGVRGSKLLSASITTLLERTLSQRLAASLKAFRRSAPSVVPGFPPSGNRGVGSLKPSPAPSTLLIIIVVACAAVVVRRARLRTRARSPLPLRALECVMAVTPRVPPCRGAHTRR